MQGTTLSDSRTYPGKVRLGFALFFGGAAWLIILGVVASLPILILHPTGTGGPLPNAIIVPIGVCAATILAAPGASSVCFVPRGSRAFIPALGARQSFSATASLSPACSPLRRSHCMRHTTDSIRGPIGIIESPNPALQRTCSEPGTLVPWNALRRLRAAGGRKR